MITDDLYKIKGKIYLKGYFLQEYVSPEDLPQMFCKSYPFISLCITWGKNFCCGCDDCKNGSSTYYRLWITTYVPGIEQSQTPCILTALICLNLVFLGMSTEEGHSSMPTSLFHTVFLQMHICWESGSSAETIICSACLSRPDPRVVYQTDIKSQLLMTNGKHANRPYTLDNTYTIIKCLSCMGAYGWDLIEWFSWQLPCTPVLAIFTTITSTNYKTTPWVDDMETDSTPGWLANNDAFQ